MKPGPFQYHRPTSVDETVDALATHDDATILAGGQSLIPMMNSRLSTPETVIDINGIDDLAYVRSEDDTIAIGALTRQADAEDSTIIGEQCPLLAEALSVIGHESIRNRGTIGGNLAHGDPTSELPAVTLAREGTFVVHGPDGERTIAAEDFFIGYTMTDVGPDELLTEIRLPAWTDDRGWSFEEVAPRKGDYALVGVAATLEVEDGTCTRARLAYSGVGDHAIRVPAAEDAVVDESADNETYAGAGSIASEQLDPPSDVHGTSAYRESLIETLTERALSRAADRTEA